ncbi:MAG TPA: hypothetical protein VNT03_00455 [Baekduia sp.]|nr:hypothetical protein [Baekduia sp.]
MTGRYALFFTLLALTGTLALPHPARASDPLLSGYAGPGSGEQVVLGGATVGAGKGGGGGDGSGGAGATANQSLRAATPADSAGSSSDNSATGTRKQRRTTSSSSKQKMNGTSTTAGGSAATTTTAAPSAGAPRVVAYPTRAGEVSGLPLSAGGALLGVAGLGLLVLVGLGLGRLRARPDDPRTMPQVPVR